MWSFVSGGADIILTNDTSFDLYKKAWRFDIWTGIFHAIFTSFAVWVLYFIKRIIFCPIRGEILRRRLVRFFMPYYEGSRRKLWTKFLERLVRFKMYRIGVCTWSRAEISKRSDYVSCRPCGIVYLFSANSKSIDVWAGRTEVCKPYLFLFALRFYSSRCQ